MPDQYFLDKATAGEHRLKTDLEGVSWDRVRLPPRNHLCWAQTKYVGRVRTILRCGCGGVSFDRGKTWANRNSRPRPWWRFW